MLVGSWWDQFPCSSMRFPLGSTALFWHLLAERAAGGYAAAHLLPGRRQGMEMPLHSRGCSWLWCQAGQLAVAGGVASALSPSSSSFVKLPMVFSQSHCSRKGDASPDSV